MLQAPASLQAPQVGSGFIAATAVAVIFEIVFPLVLALLVRRRLGVGWRYFGFGALVFFLAQLATRLPAMQIVQAAIAPQLQASAALSWAWLAVAALSAGLFEEVGRYLGYRILMGREEKTWRKAIMYGLGHGGLESMLLVAGLTALTLVNLIALSRSGLEALPEGQRALAVEQLAAIAAQPEWTGLVGAWERACVLPIQVAFAVVVLQVFRRQSLAWLWLAVFAHAALDFVSVAVARALGGTLTAILAVEGLLTVLAAVAIWTIWRLRDDAQAGGPSLADGRSETESRR